ncbi:MAG: tail fiber domain-containing protein [Bacteroidota bacterium]
MKQYFLLLILFCCSGASAQFVGIGTDAPGFPLHLSVTDPYFRTGFVHTSVSTGTSMGTRIYETKETALFAGYNAVNLSLEVNNIIGLSVSKLGNVQLRAQNTTVSPAELNARLYVEGAEMAGGTVAIKGTTHTSHFNYGTEEDTYIRGGKAGSRLILNDGGTGNVLIAGSGGNVGIGTGNLSLFSRLTVGTPSGITGLEHTNGTVRLATYAGLGGSQIGYLGTVSNHDFYLFANNTTRMVIRTNGSVGINTVNPSAWLTIRAAVAQAAIRITDADDANPWGLSRNTDGINPVLAFSYNGVNKSQIQSTDGSYITLSDERAKTGITPMGNVLDKVMQLQPASYQMKDMQGGKPSIGFVAQQVQPLFPDIIASFGKLKPGEGGPDDYIGLNYAAFGVIAIKAIQEQQAQIEELKREIESLKRINKN